MKCPFCGQENTRVIDSRPVPDNNSIRRRRQCDECGKRFTTYEKIETIPLVVIKKDQSREQYDRSKIQGGVTRACYKRPISVKKIEELIDDIETEIFNKEEREIPSTLIGGNCYGQAQGAGCSGLCPICVCISGIQRY